VNGYLSRFDAIVIGGVCVAFLLVIGAFVLRHSAF
jgi:hypothetical protein